MGYFMYMGGASKLVLTVFYLPICLLILFLINRFLRKRPLQSKYRIAIISILACGMFFFATWDAILGKYYLDKYCEADGGTYINTDERVDGLYFPQTPHPRYVKRYLEMGYSYVDMGINGDYVRYMLDDNGVIEDAKIDRYTSRVMTDSKHTEVGPSYLHITMLHIFMMDRESKKILGGFKDYSISTDLDYRLGGLGAIGGTSCTDLAKFNKQERFNHDRNYEYKLANIGIYTGSK